MDSKASPDGEGGSRLFLELTTGELFYYLKTEIEKDGVETLVITNGAIPKTVSPNTKFGISRKRYVLLFNEGLEMLKHMLDERGRVLLALCKLMKYGNKVHASNAGIADLTGIRKNHVSRAIKGLLELGALERCQPDPGIPDVPAYKVDSRFLFRGTEEARNAAVERDGRARAMKAVMEDRGVTI